MFSHNKQYKNTLFESQTNFFIPAFFIIFNETCKLDIMKQPFIFLIAIILFSCSEETIQSTSSNTPQKEISFKTNKAMHIKALSQDKLTDAERNFHNKITRLSGDEFKHQLKTLSSKELEKFAISFLLEDSKKLLSGNNYSHKQLEQLNDFDLVQKAIKTYNEKINNQL